MNTDPILPNLQMHRLLGNINPPESGAFFF